MSVCFRRAIGAEEGPAGIQGLSGQDFDVLCSIAREVESVFDHMRVKINISTARKNLTERRSNLLAYFVCGLVAVKRMGGHLGVSRTVDAHCLKVIIEVE